MNLHAGLFSNGAIPRSNSFERGKYGRLFPTLPPFAPDTPQMREKLREFAFNGRFRGKGPSPLPAGYTYLGQFIAHDLTFDTTSIAQRQVDPEQVWNFRTPALDLDSVYGAGPLANPIFYKAEPNSLRVRLRLEGNDWKNPTFYDLARTVEVTDARTDACPDACKVNRKDALIPDPRNDENPIVSQLHLAFVSLHNHFIEQHEAAAVETARKKAIEQGKYKAGDAIVLSLDEKMAVFLAAQQQTRWHYQYVILHDYLPRIVGSNMVNQVRKDEVGRVRRRFFDWRNEPFIPLEFSVAAFRFGHSQVFGSYAFNDAHPDVSIFKKDGSSGPPETYVDWSFFFPSKDRVDAGLNKSRFPNTVISNEMASLPDVMDKLEKNIFYRNLVKGLMMELPSGQSVAKAMSLPELQVIGDGIPPEFENNTPLWFYVLYEAEMKQNEKIEFARKPNSPQARAAQAAPEDIPGVLGPVGSRIVAEVLVGLLEGDKNSFLHHDPKWQPEKVKNGSQDTYGMKDLLEDAGVFRGATIPPFVFPG